MALIAALIAWIGLVPALVVWLRLKAPAPGSSLRPATAAACPALGRRRLRADRVAHPVSANHPPHPLDRNRH